MIKSKTKKRAIVVMGPDTVSNEQFDEITYPAPFAGAASFPFPALGRPV